jgi:AraC family transcriptional regulator
MCTEQTWSDLAVRAFHMPDTMNLYQVPPVPALTLGLATHGAMYLEQRQASGQWQGFLVRPGDLSLRPAACEPPTFRWQRCSPDAIETIAVYLDQDVLFHVMEEVAEGDPATLVIEEQVRFHDPLLLQLGLALHHELDHPTASGRLYAQTAAQLLAVHLLQHYTSVKPHIWEPARGLSQRQVRRVLEFVHTHLQHDLSLATLAQQVHLSPYHFARMFRQATGESPHQCVLRLRLERAQWLLTNTDLPIAQVALESGFAHQSNLTNTFKRRLGLTPRAYRHST